MLTHIICFPNRTFINIDGSHRLKYKSRSFGTIMPIISTLAGTANSFYGFAVTLKTLDSKNVAIFAMTKIKNCECDSCSNSRNLSLNEYTKFHGLRGKVSILPEMLAFPSI